MQRAWRLAATIHATRYKHAAAAADDDDDNNDDNLLYCMRVRAGSGVGKKLGSWT